MSRKGICQRTKKTRKRKRDTHAILPPTVRASVSNSSRCSSPLLLRASSPSARRNRSLSYLNRVPVAALLHHRHRRQPPASRRAAWNRGHVLRSAAPPQQTMSTVRLLGPREQCDPSSDVYKGFAARADAVPKCGPGWQRHVAPGFCAGRVRLSDSHISSSLSCDFFHLKFMPFEMIIYQAAAHALTAVAVLCRWVAKEARPISLRQLMVFGRSLTESRLISSANYVRTELPVRYVDCCR